MDSFIRALGAVVLQVNRFQPHSVQLRQWQNFTLYVTLPLPLPLPHSMNILAEKPLPLPHRVNGPLIIAISVFDLRGSGILENA